MIFLTRGTIRSRLLLSLAAVTVLLTVPLAVAGVALKQQRDALAELQDQEFAASVRIGRLRASTENLRTTALAAADSRAWAESAEAAARLTAIAELLTPYAWAAGTDEFQASVAELARHVAGAHASIRTGDAEGVARARDTIAVASAAAIRSLNAIERAVQGRIAARVDRANARSSRALTVAAVSFAAALALAIAVAVSLTRAIGRPVEDLKRGFEAVADGRLDHRLATDAARPDEFGYLSAAFAGMVDRLDDLEKLRVVWMGQFTHELKTPLVVIQGTLEMFREGIYAQLTPEGADFCARSLRASRTLQGRIMNMIEVGKFMAGHGQIEPRAFDLDVFLGDLDATFQVLGAREQIEFSLVRGGELPARVEWDEDRIREVFENLVSNAFKFTPRGGRVELRAWADGGTVSLRVSDTGAGIPPEAISHLFDHFYQADNQRFASRKGTGLGLAIVKRIVDAHGGGITVESVVGEGTSFTVLLPSRIESPAVALPD